MARIGWWDGHGWQGVTLSERVRASLEDGLDDLAERAHDEGDTALGACAVENISAAQLACTLPETRFSA